MLYLPYLFAFLLAGFIPSSVKAEGAPLEPPDGKLYFGPWYDRLHGETVEDITNRFNYKKFSMVQSDINISSTLQYPDQFIEQLEDTNSDTIMYLTVYPYDGFDEVSDDALNEFVSYVIKIVKSGRRLFIRYASEMNGSWFAYGQQPEAFLTSWRKVVDLVRSGVPDEYSQMFAFIWAPNSGNGYPFPDGLSSVQAGTQAYQTLDTNGDGEVTIADDPYSPYYPGDDYVDWVGFSMYHYGAYWPWQQNVLPDSTQVRSMLLGVNNYGNYNIYGTFCDKSVNYGGILTTSVSSGNKPFIITETGATYHEMNITGQLIDPGPGRVAIKEAWWEQIFNKTLLNEFKEIKAISTFEFQKWEELTLRDFTIFGAYNLTWRNSTEEVDAVMYKFRADVGNYDWIIWGNTTNSTDDDEHSTGSSKSAGYYVLPPLVNIAGTLASIFFVWMYFTH